VFIVHIRLVGVQFLTLAVFVSFFVCDRQNINELGTRMGKRTSQKPVTAITAAPNHAAQNSNQEGFMPILMVALLALAAFGLIGIFLGAAVVLEQRKAIGKEHHGKAA
jgi:hypothetical protein